MMFDTLSEWLNYIETLHTSSIDLDLKRIVNIAKAMDVVSFHCPVIIVGGTNGKGSVVCLLEAIYSSAGYRVGTYTSPHLSRFNERIRIGENEIDDLELIKNFKAVEKARQKKPLSFFEFTTLAALYFFKNACPDILILEVGLGGRLDAVNVVEPDLSIVVTVDIDHCDWLGNNKEDIGFEKAGIFRKDKPAIYGDLDPPKRLLNHAKQLDVDLYLANKNYGFTKLPSQWEWWTRNKIISTLPFPKLKIENASTALMAVELLQSTLPVNQKAMSEGIAKANLPGRFEYFTSPVECILDIAHNPQAAKHLAQSLNQSNFSGITYAVIGMLRDKEIQKTLAPLLQCVDTWFVADLSVPRGNTAENIILHLKAKQVEKCYNFSSVKEATLSAIQASLSQKAMARILVFGSFYTVAQAKQLLLEEIK